jgi:hypothetical protein
MRRASAILRVAELPKETELLLHERLPRHRFGKVSISSEKVQRKNLSRLSNTDLILISCRSATPEDQPL